jgi:hypothetical protein
VVYFDGNEILVLGFPEVLPLGATRVQRHAKRSDEGVIQEVLVLSIFNRTPSILAFPLDGFELE